MSGLSPQRRISTRVAALAVVLEAALGLRVAAADVVQWYSHRKGTLCVFPDTNIYWLLAETIRRGEPFEVTYWGDLPHFALRTPGYPLFLAACQTVFGARVLPIRLVQAVLGVVGVWLVARLTRAVLPWSARREPLVPLLAAALAAVDPYAVVTSALVLSEALFIPLMLAALWGLAALWPAEGAEGPRRRDLVALGVGAASGAAILVRPSWALCVPALLAAWVALGRGHRREAARGALVVLLGVVLVMAPWWVRNARVYGRFVPTALWMGASLYDGVNPHATGASDMEFLNDREFWPLGEEEQDAELIRRAWRFAREHPGRVAQLAAIKFARYWSPWPNADSFRSTGLAVASALWTLPLFGLWVAGAWDRRRDGRALVLLAGPLLYFCALHLIFAGSMRYRIPGAVPACGLAAIGWKRVAGHLKWKSFDGFQHSQGGLRCADPPCEC